VANSRYLDFDLLASISNMELLAQTVVEGFLLGLHRSPFRGFSVEFAEYRQYTPGDEVRFIDWRVYARSDRFYVKRYEQDTNLEAHFLVDASRSMFFRSDEAAMSKFDYAATVVSSLAFLLMQQKDTFGMIVFDEQVRTTLPARGSHGHFRNMTRVLDESKPGGETNLGEAMFALGPHLKGRALVFVVSDFLGDLERFNLGLGRMSFGNHDLAMFHVRDPIERDFPFSGQTIFLGPENEGRLLCEPRDLRNAYLRARRNHEAELRSIALRYGYDVEPIDTDAPLDEAMSKFLADRLARRKRG
jgi:uncharacterized protein (DUF58 family)